jgi:multidrug efflux pump subunit AcrA (membrane-fusion protein)
LIEIKRPFRAYYTVMRLARDGDVVKEGDLLVRLHDTQAKANLTIVTKSIDELSAHQARKGPSPKGCFKSFHIEQATAFKRSGCRSARLPQRRAVK